MNVLTEAQQAALREVRNGAPRQEAPTMTTTQPTPDEARAELTALLGLASVDLSVARARVVGRGALASADLHLSDGSVVEFPTIRDLGNASRLTLEIAACTGATPKLKAPDAIRAVVLVRAIADHAETLTADEISADMGVSYLQTAQVLDLNMTDQAERWGAFSHLASIDPIRQQQTDGTPYAAATVVLRHTNGNRFVRCGWFYNFARSLDLGVGQAELAHRMQRAGWQRRGTRGAIKATAPDRRDELSWTFYTVPADWLETLR